MASVILHKDINLLPKYKLKEKDSQRSHNLLFISFVGVLIISIAVALLFVKSYTDLVSRENVINGEIAKMEATENQIKELDSVKASIDERKKYQDNIEKSNTSMIKLLEFLEGEVSSIYLSGLSDGATSTGAKQITITGSAINKDTVADFSAKLRASDLFSDVLISSVTEADKATSSSVFGDTVSDTPLAKFTIVCTLS